MEMKLSISLICFTLATFLVQESNGFKCYQCGSLLSYDSACEDPFTDSGVQTVDCTGSCSKSKLEVNGQQVISRGCSPLLESNECSQQTQSGVEANVCTCTSDLCNTATSATATMTTLLFTSLGTILYTLI